MCQTGESGISLLVTYLLQELFIELAISSPDEFLVFILSGQPQVHPLKLRSSTLQHMVDCADELIVSAIVPLL